MWRILCLHGSGSSAGIFESQLANVRSLLPKSYNFDFVDAPIECGAAPGLVEVFPGPYHCFFEEYSEVCMKKAVEFVHGIVEEDGPYDCIIGFSQGAYVAAAYLSQQRVRYSVPCSLKMAVLLCAAVIPPELVGEDVLNTTIAGSIAIDIPTVHVVGSKDPCRPQSLALVKSCVLRNAQVLLHDGGHDIPRDLPNTKKIAAGIERGLSSES